MAITDAQKRAIKKYRISLKGKEASRRGAAKYGRSLKGKITRAKYVASPKFKAVLARYFQKYPERLKAMRIVSNALQYRLIVKPSICSICNKDFPVNKIQAHHEDYNKPLDIVWCCPKCHKHIGR